MSALVAILSMLHEPADVNSATRAFRGQPVLSRTLRQLGKVDRVESVFVICWDDQSPAVERVRAALGCPVTDGHSSGGATVANEIQIACKGRRHPVASLDALSAAGRWIDGWRGGLLQTCDFDAGFHGGWIHELAGESDVLLIDPAAGLLDPEFINALIDRAERQNEVDLVFSQAPPGLSGAIVRNSLLGRLVSSNQHPGRLLHYLPDQPGRDPIAGEACVEIPVQLARSTANFKLNSRRQIDRFEVFEEPHWRAAMSTLQSSATDSMPREVVLELTTRRSTKPIFAAARHLEISRPDLSVDLAQIIARELSSVDDLRLTLAGAGDPLCHPDFFEIIQSFRSEGVIAIHVETDLHDLDSARVAGLVEAGIDLISVNLPAITAATYAKIMGVNGYAAVVNNIKQLLIRRQGLSRGTPILIPTFVKCQDNLAEMEIWYDQWLRALGVAVITAPTDYADQIPVTAVAEMAPPRRKACVRLARRMTILSDGRVVSCEQDVLARQVMGEIPRERILNIWNGTFNSLRADHGAGQWNRRPLCAACKEWHRP